MECKKYWEILEISTLDRLRIEDTRIKLDEHISLCKLCKEKFNKIEKYDSITKTEMDNIIIPEDLESKIKLNLVEVKFNNSNRIKKYLIISLLLLIILLVILLKI